MVESRPFQGFWKHFKEFDKKRSNQEIQGYLNTLHAFAKDINIQIFLQECKKIVSFTEMAVYYKNNLETQQDFEKFLSDVSRTTTHEWVLYFSIYYSSWTGSMVLEKDKVFSKFDQVIISCTNEGADQSLQHVLQQIIRIIGFEQWKKHLKDLNINRNIGILKEKYVVSLDYIMNLDIIEARHQLDNLVCYSGLKDTTFYDLQKGLGIEPTLQRVENFMQQEYNNQSRYEQSQQQQMIQAQREILKQQKQEQSFGTQIEGQAAQSNLAQTSGSSQNPQSQNLSQGYGQNVQMPMSMPMGDGIVMGIPQHAGMVLGEPQDLSHFGHVMAQNAHLCGHAAQQHQINQHGSQQIQVGPSSPLAGQKKGGFAIGADGKSIVGQQATQSQVSAAGQQPALQVISDQKQLQESSQAEQVPAPTNLFYKLQKAILAVQEEKNGSQVKNLCSLIDKMTPRLFLKACKERGDAIMEFIGPEIDENGGNVKKAIETVGDYVSEVVWAEILAEAQLDDQGLAAAQQ